MRLDAYLTAFGFAASRTRAKNLIESGRVGVDGKNVTKPAFDVPENAVVAGIPAKLIKYRDAQTNGKTALVDALREL